MPQITATISIVPPGVPAYIASMATNQSKQLSSVANGRATFSSALPAGMSSYNSPVGAIPDDGLFRYSGGGVDHTRALMYMHGGGHNDHWWNGIVQFDFNGATVPNGFSLVPGSDSAFALAAQSVDNYSDGRPTSIHSYDNVVIDWVGNYFIRNGGSAFSPGGGPTARAWRFNLASGSWGASINGDMGSSSDSLSMVSGFDPVTRRAIFIGPNGRYRIYDTVNHTFLTAAAQIGSNSTHSVMAWVWPENFGLCWNADGGFFRYSLSGTTLTRAAVTMGGAAVPAGYGACACYDPYNNRIWLYNPSVNTGVLYEVSWTAGGASFTATARTLTGQVPPAPATTHNYKRFGVLKDWGALGYVGAVNQNAYVFRVGTAVAPAGSLSFASNAAGAANYDNAQMTALPSGFGSGEFTLEMHVKLDQNAPVGSTSPVAGSTAGERTNWASENPTRYGATDWWWAGNFLLDGFHLQNFSAGSIGVQFFNGGRPRWIMGDPASAALTGGMWGMQNPTMPTLLDGQWHRISLVRRFTGTSESTYELWVDGVLRDSQVSSSRVDFWTNYWNGMAGYPVNQRQWIWGAEKQAVLGIINQYADFKGLLGEVRFWSVARSSVALAAGGAVSGSETGLIGLYRHGAGSGTTSANSQGAGAPINLLNGVSWSTDKPY